MPDGDEGQTGLQEANKDSLNNETPNNTEYLLQKNLEYLLAQQQVALLKKQQMSLTNLQSIFVSSQQTHSMESSGPSKQGTNDISTGSIGSSRQGTNSCVIIKTRTKNIIIKQVTKENILWVMKVVVMMIGYQ